MRVGTVADPPLTVVRIAVVGISVWDVLFIPGGVVVLLVVNGTPRGGFCNSRQRPSMKNTSPAVDVIDKQML